ncbi:hypothetical protein SAMN02745225_02029 [Ferrithrix thermotolerans DSM 19514]|uniref:Uncharacterized protein n=1 Tax=Ferrithrix thermotolerans DSM 19514 TaxID=1121881 RepID=A0A1M4XHS1_9ACTN|nr:hypothetical protein SAMN02745225_02029 [Ferrithrix thermotolerans DSM 19514]
MGYLNHLAALDQRVTEANQVEGACDRSRPRSSTAPHRQIYKESLSEPKAHTAQITFRRLHNLAQRVICKFDAAP